MEINGNYDISDAELLDFCKNQKVYIGTYKHSINIDSLKANIRKKYH